MKKKYHFTEEIDARIRKAYQEEVGMKTKLHTGYLSKLSEELDMPSWRISKRATELGVLPTKKKEANWNTRELRILESSSHLSLSRIQKNLKRVGFQRTQQGIQQKRKHMRYLQNLNGHSAASVAVGFGIDKKGVVGRIEKGWLRASRRETTRDEGNANMYYIKDKWIKEFIVESVAVIDFRKLDKYWIVDILAN